MSITVTNPACKVGFIANGFTANASSCEELVAAVASKKIKVKHLTVNSGAAITITIGEGETTNAVTTALIGPISFAANSSLQWDFNPPMELTAATALTVDASGAGDVCVFAQGVIE
jgi:hypothetical protein